ncbi:MAG: hypothetical protein MI923_29770 [Phycisphaerales bacterium]|nr:hypothetical protein [Phycisphaerales bacterium]
MTKKVILSEWRPPFNGKSGGIAVLNRPPNGRPTSSDSYPPDRIAPTMGNIV